jgi:hypothetical protein
MNILKAPSGAPVIQSRPQALTVRNMQQVTAQLNRPINGPYNQYLRGKPIPQYMKNGVRQQLATRAPPPYKRSGPVSPAMALMTQATSLPLGVPAFKPIPPPDPNLNVNQILKMTTLSPSQSIGLAHQVTDSFLTPLLTRNFFYFKIIP